MGYKHGLQAWAIRATVRLGTVRCVGLFVFLSIYVYFFEWLVREYVHVCLCMGGYTVVLMKMSLCCIRVPHIKVFLFFLHSCNAVKKT